MFDVQTDASVPGISSSGSKRKRMAKGGIIPVDCTRRFSLLLSLALMVLLKDLYTVLENNKGFKPESRTILFIKENHGRNVLRLTAASWYLCNERFHFFLTRKTFTKDVSRWIGYVSYCYLMRFHLESCLFIITFQRKQFAASD